MPAWFSTVTRIEPNAPVALAAAGLALLALVAGPAAAQLPIAGDTDPARGQQRPLPIAQAFPWYVSEAAPGRFQVVFNPAPAHYLYRHAFNFRLRTGTEEHALEVQLPPGLARHDQFFGDVIAYYDQVAIALDHAPELATGGILLIEFQGCADWGFCYPPQQARFELPRPPPPDSEALQSGA